MPTPSTILIVDDNQNNLDTLAALLAPEGYTLAFTSSGTEAIGRALELHPDLVLLDVMMPGMSGFTVCSHFRANSVLADVPIVLVTALDDRDSRLAGIQSGADDFITRPFDKVELRARVRCITNLNRFRRLHASRAKFKWIADHSPDGYVALDENLDLIYANSAARLYLGLTPDLDQPVGGNFLAAVQTAYQQEPRAAWAEWLSAREPVASSPPLYLVRPETPHAPAFWLLVETMKTTEDQVPGLLVRLTDITTQATQRAQSWSFYNQVAHKIRAPLTGMMGSLEVLTGDTAALTPAEITQFAQFTLQSVHRLHRDLEDVLRLARLKPVRDVAEGFPLDGLPALVEQVAAQLQLPDVSFSMGGSLNGRQLPLTSASLEVILTELLENAVKFHPRKQPHVTVRADHASPNELTLTIRDDGLTLSPAQLRQVFTPYYQAEKWHTGEVAGMGLGLATVATLVWGVGGQCHLMNRLDGPGIQVELKLPLAATAPPGPSAARPMAELPVAG